MKLKTISAVIVVLAVGSLFAAAVNVPAPEFALKDLGGKEYRLKDSAGKVVLVNFWATWCPPCHKEFPELSRLADEYKSKGLDVFAINLDKKTESIHQFLKKTTPRPLHILLDPKGKVADMYEVPAMPSSFLVDKKGVIRYVHTGYSEKDPAKWREEIDKLLALP